MVKEMIEFYQSITLKTIGSRFCYSTVPYSPEYQAIYQNGATYPKLKTLSDLSRYQGESQICQTKQKQKNLVSVSIRKFTLLNPHIKDIY